MNKNNLLKYANDVKLGLCKNCTICKFGNYTPCLERQSIEQLIEFAEKYMNREGTFLAPGIYDRR